MKKPSSPPITNTYPFWVRRLVTLDMVAGFTSISFIVPRTQDYELKKVFYRFPVTGGLNSTFIVPKVEVINVGFGNRMKSPVLVDLISTPGAEVNTATQTGLAQWKNALSEDLYLLGQQSVEIKFSEYTGVGAPATIDMVLYGRIISRFFDV